MLKRKFGNGKHGSWGPWVYKGHQINMYELTKFLAHRYQITGIKVPPSELTPEIAAEFLDIKLMLETLE